MARLTVMSASKRLYPVSGDSLGCLFGKTKVEFYLENNKIHIILPNSRFDFERIERYIADYLNGIEEKFGLPDDSMLIICKESGYYVDNYLTFESDIYDIYEIIATSLI